ncbi:hypothetical protein DOTSEDRAFT_23927 [Dothistroma septosporum NZE10]|uniref:Uncharacterized protein n=1 Tax=Dothistroma septosporum (strain NZE10 / CBS 128990) TaxID=675120 RepID=N1PJW7_DOTSN|nr:hypothetical protein DOTSEDRAFT_23927 [Dothistroma septosporum NZE10]
MVTLHDLRTLVSQAERTLKTRKDDLHDAQDHELRVQDDCGHGKYNKEWSKARGATQRALTKYETSSREADKLHRIIQEREVKEERPIRRSPFSSADPYVRQGAAAATSTQRQQILLFKDAVTQWREQCVKRFAGYSAIELFPAPPTKRPCAKQSCCSETRALHTCKCQIQLAFSSVPGLDLKKERIEWHPDKFSGCGDKRKEFQAKAKEIFIIVSSMYRQA